MGARGTPIRRVVFTIYCRRYEHAGECPDEKYYNCTYCNHNAVRRGRLQLQFKR